MEKLIESDVVLVVKRESRKVRCPLWCLMPGGRLRDEEEEVEEEPVKEVPGKRKKEMTKQKAAPEAKKQKVEATEPTTSFHLIGTSRKFGYVDFESAEDLEKALELTGLKVFGNEIKLEKPKGKDNKKDRDARTLLAKNLPYKVTQDELKEVFEDAMEIRIISKDGKSKGIAYIEFKTEADAEKTFEEKQGTEIDGRSISLYYTGEKGQNQDYREPLGSVATLMLLCKFGGWFLCTNAGVRVKEDHRDSPGQEAVGRIGVPCGLEQKRLNLRPAKPDWEVRALGLGHPGGPDERVGLEVPRRGGLDMH
ncbi:Nucleolin [Tupaia chinensis]|uniref:Nucleolin n=1 Tax=Tupaia chinensis TaxID=246437 RepID=L9L248_TUPCH|nr:Nucleolin [Tupaia chinensis]